MFVLEKCRPLFEVRFSDAAAFGTSVRSTASVRLSSRLVLAIALEKTSKTSAIALFCMPSPTPSKSNLAKPVFSVRTEVRFIPYKLTRYAMENAELELFSHYLGFLWCWIRNDGRKLAIRKEGVCQFQDQACGGVHMQ